MNDELKNKLIDNLDYVLPDYSVSLTEVGMSNPETIAKKVLEMYLNINPGGDDSMVKEQLSKVKIPFSLLD